MLPLLIPWTRRRANAQRWIHREAPPAAVAARARFLGRVLRQSDAGGEGRPASRCQEVVGAFIDSCRVAKKARMLYRER